MKTLPLPILSLSLLLLLLLTHTQSCLDPTEPPTNCTQCPLPQLLINATCYDRPRGCLTYQVVNRTLSCLTCQTGYVVFSGRCQRKGVVDVLMGVPVEKVNVPPPVVVDNPGNLTKGNITGNGSEVNSTASEPKRNQTKTLPIFPQPKILTLPASSFNTTKFQPPSPSKLAQAQSQLPVLSPTIQKLIAKKYPNLANLKPVQVGYENDRNIFYGQDRLWLVYQEGTVLAVEKMRNGYMKSQTVDYSISELYRNKNVERELTRIRQLINETTPDSLLPSLSINYKLKLPTNQTITLNFDLATSQTHLLTSSECSPEAYKGYAKVSDLPRYIAYLKIAYASFLESSAVVNVPDAVAAVDVYRGEGVVDVVFKVVYNAVTEAEQQYLLMKYNSDKNATEILGYFIEGSNILNLFKNTTNATNATTGANTPNDTAAPANTTNSTTNANPEPATNTTTTNSTNVTAVNTTAANATVNSTAADSNLNVADILKKPVLGAQLKNCTNQTGVAQQEQKEPVEQTYKVLPSVIKSQSDLVTYLLKTQFAPNLGKGYKLFSFLNESNNLAEVVYKAKIVTPASVYSVSVIQNLYNNELSDISLIENDCSCLQIFNDPISTKLDSYLRKSYPLLQPFTHLTTEFKLDQIGQKYYLIYWNDQMKRMIFEVTKKKEMMNYAITRTELHDSGYCFQKKNLENLELQLWKYGGEMVEEAGNFGFLKCYKEILEELMGKYRSYVFNGTLVAILGNGTHVRMYVSNKFATFEYTRRVEGKEREKENGKEKEAVKGEFLLIEQKYGSHVLPLGFKREALMTSTDPQYATYKPIEDSLVKKYKNYFGGGNLEVFVQKKQSQQAYEIAFKTVLGYFSLTATPTGKQSVSVSPLKKNYQFEQPRPIPSCKSNEYLDTIESKCYLKITGCYRQIGSICIACQPEFILQAGRKECRRSCAW